MSRSLRIVNEFFPDVTTVHDATKGITIEVTKHDAATSAKKDHKTCAAAVACKRQMHLDGVIISRAIAYMVKGTVATRYVLPESLAREVIAFDRGGSFEPGEYTLKKPDKHILIGTKRKGRNNTKHNKGRGVLHHVTQNIRTVLGGKVR